MTGLPNDATAAQIEAATPTASTWLSANAGSGKTRVLTDRVARLLLMGVDPQNILCLTFTKAAAAEMQNRLFKRLGEWAMMEAGALRQQLQELGPEQPDELAHARRLFARAIETPGGLKIQTIHAFCASVLRRFPLEAGVSPRFAEMEDRAAELLRGEVLDTIAEREPALVDRFARAFTGPEIAPFLAELARRADLVHVAPDMGSLAEQFDTDPHDSVDEMLDRELGDIAEELDALRSACANGSTNDQKLAAALAPLNGRIRINREDFAVLCKQFLTGSSAKEPFTSKAGKIPTKATRNSHADLAERVDDIMNIVEDLRPRVLAHEAFERTSIMLDFGRAFLAEYQARKRAKGALDFDDLIGKTRKLLTDPALAQWVLFRLDGGIEHILVDEAQDTSPTQWAVVERLTEELGAGLGAHPDRPRTLFVVGDKKQSIYSFQGADADAFDSMKDAFGTRLSEGGGELRKLPLEFSFRSSPAILTLVDAVFTGEMAEGLDREVFHRAFHGDLPGRVDLWPAVEKPEKPDDDVPWFEPVDQVGQQHETVRLAEQIADWIQALISPSGTGTIPDFVNKKAIRRKVRPGDILILVQRRSRLFGEIIRACKDRGLPIAGRDRLKVGGEMAVKDLAALMRFLALPEDDLSLAAALRSPLFGWSEQDLFTVAHGRPPGSYLWRALRDREYFEETRAVLNDLRDQADFLRPYDILSRILVRHDGRRRLVARLGAEAEDGIDALLAQALAYERSEIPSLTGFVGWIETEDVEVKRQMDAQGDRIRVMTVHGSKGLEAPIVILPDTGKRQRNLRASLWPHGDTVAWPPKSEDLPDALADTKDALLAAQDRERRRLLYVAMTRAEKWLVVAAAGEVGNDPTDSWYKAIEGGLGTVGSKPMDEAQRYETGNWDALPLDSVDVPLEATVPAPTFPEMTLPERPETVSPSELGGAKVIGDELTGDLDAALDRGSAMHILLEYLPANPEETWPDLAKTLLRDRDDSAQLLAEARRILADPDLKTIFGPNSLAEVSVTAEIPGLGRIHGAIDRLVPGDEILAVDFKTNRIAPDTPEDVPEGLRRQMGAYHAALTQIYPGRKIRTAILWTATATLMELPEPDVTAALCRAAEP